MVETLQGTVRKVIRLDTGRHSPIPQLIEALYDRDMSVHMQAQCDLAQLGPLAIPALLEVLGNRDEDPVAYMAVGSVLSRIGPRAVPALIETLKSSDDRISSRVASVILRIGTESEEVPPEFTSALDDEHAQVRQLIVQAIGRMRFRAKPTIPLLQRLAKEDPDEEIRRCATVALEKIRCSCKVLDQKE